MSAARSSSMVLKVLTHSRFSFRIPWGERPALWQSEVATTHSGGDHATVADRPEAPTAIRTDLGAIFVSLELSRSTWLITSLWPGGGEKMSKQVVRGGDVAELLEGFARLREKARARTGKVYLFVVIQEAGLDGFWIDRTCLIQSRMHKRAKRATRKAR